MEMLREAEIRTKNGMRYRADVIISSDLSATYDHIKNSTIKQLKELGYNESHNYSVLAVLCDRAMGMYVATVESDVSLVNALRNGCVPKIMNNDDKISNPNDIPDEFTNNDEYEMSK